jgi:hypothetical protein
MYIHYKNGFGHKENHNKGGKPGNGGSSQCYAFLAKGARWKTVEEYVIDPGNSRGLDENIVRTLTGTSLNTWDTEVTANIFGAASTTNTVDGADTVSPDGKNEVMFGSISSPGAIAVTIVWGIFSGPPSQRELVEWDAVFDEVDYDWSTSGEAGKMDYQNIAAHEFGHAAGLGHPEGACTEETMYATADFGETKKRDLNTGDIAGINELYK